MERFYDGDQEKLFAEARVVNPFTKGPLINRNQSSQSSLVSKFEGFSEHRSEFTFVIYLRFLVQENVDERHRGMWNMFYHSTICSMCTQIYINSSIV